jgi:hypothetical protein
MSQVTLQGDASGTGVFTIAAPNSNTNRTLNLPDAAGDVVLTTATQTLTNKSISGAQINSGTVAAARLGSGTPGTGNFLRGDGSWQAVPASAPSTTDVLNATAGASVGAVGTYAFLRPANTTTYSAGSTLAGSSLRYNEGITGGNNMSSIDGATPSGTWRAMGHRQAQQFISGEGTSASSSAATLWLRIS